MNGYIITKKGKYNFLNLIPGKTYELVTDSLDVNLKFKVYTNPDDLFLNQPYKKDVTKIFKVKILGDMTIVGLSKHTNKITVLEEIDPSKYNTFFKNFVFDDNLRIKENKSENKVYEYDDKGNLIHFKGGTYEEWYEYDSNNNVIHFKNSKVTEEFYQYDEKNNLVYAQRLPSKTEYWMTYDEKNNLILQKSNEGYENYGQYDSNNNLINFKTNTGFESNYQYDKDNNFISYEDNSSKNSNYKFTVS